MRTNVFSSGNDGNGIELVGDASGVTIVPNIAGLTTKGGAVLPNRGDGVLIDGSARHNPVGGSLVSVIPQNTLSGNDGYGLAITGSVYDNSVLDTFIGTDVLGTKALGNHKGSVLVGGRAHGNLTGNTGKPPVNLISGNTGTGVELSAATSGNRVTRNYIGLNRFRKPLRNSGKPIENQGHHNVISGNIT